MVFKYFKNCYPPASVNDTFSMFVDIKMVGSLFLPVEVKFIVNKVAMASGWMGRGCQEIVVKPGLRDSLVQVTKPLTAIKKFHWT